LGRFPDDQPFQNILHPNLPDIYYLEKQLLVAPLSEVEEIRVFTGDVVVSCAIGKLIIYCGVMFVV
jgi:hypothetical protein